MKRVPIKEVLLLVLPTMILWVVGSWSQKLEQRDASPVNADRAEKETYRVEVVNVEKLVPSPAEVAQGFDTRFVFTFKESGDKFPPSDDKRNPSGMTFFRVMPRRFLVREKDQWREIRFPATSPYMGGARRPRNFKRGDRVFMITLPMAKLPPKELRLEATALLTTMREVPKGSVKSVPGKIMVSGNGAAPTSDSVTYLQSCPVILPLRKAGEKPFVPKVSRARSFRLRSVKVARVNPQTSNPAINRYPGTDTRVTIEIQSATQAKQPKLLSVGTIGPRLFDEQGEEHFKPKGFSTDLSDENFHRERFAFPSSEQPAPSDGIYRMQLWFATDYIPASAGQITFKMQLYVNNEWPWDISTVIRERKTKRP